MKKTMALALSISVMSLTWVQEAKPGYEYAKRLAGMVILTLILGKTLPKKRCKEIAQFIETAGPVIGMIILGQPSILDR